MSIEKLLADYNIPTSTGGKNWQTGWIQVNCPLCHDQGFHGGFNISGGYYNCWKCGYHRMETVLSTLLGIKWHEARNIMNQYAGSSSSSNPIPKKKAQAKECQWPDNCHDLQHNHKKYLINRKGGGFNHDQLVHNWNIKGTGPIGPYKFRIIIPIYFDGKLVSYQGRDITGKSDLRYKACPIEKEVVHHKHICYGLDHVKNRKAVVVEGVFDVWRLGYGSVCTFGTEVTNEQVLLLANRLDYAAIAFDPGAEFKANQLGGRLIALGVDVDLVEINAADPAELSELEASRIMKLVR